MFDIISKMSLYCIAEISTEVRTLTSQLRSVLSRKTTLYLRRRQSQCSVQQHQGGFLAGLGSPVLKEPHCVFLVPGVRVLVESAVNHLCTAMSSNWPLLVLEAVSGPSRVVFAGRLWSMNSTGGQFLHSAPLNLQCQVYIVLHT